MNNVQLNPTPAAPVVPKSGLVGKRYSNAEATADAGTATGSGSGSFNWGSFLSDLLKSGSSIIGSIWGKGDQYTAMAYQSMYEQEKQTTKILIGIVIALVVLAFAFLIIKRK